MIRSICAFALLLGACTTTREATPVAVPPVVEAKSSIPFSKNEAAHRLVIVHLSDSEAGLLPDAGSPIGGLARTQTVLRALEERSKANALVVGAGDLFIPAPELSLELPRPLAPSPKAGEGEKGPPVSAVLQGNTMLSLRASALGNHELDLGEQFLADAIAMMNFPYLSATLEVKGGPLQKVLGDVSGQTQWASAVAGKLVPRAKVCVGGSEDGGTCAGLVVGLVGATTEELRLISAGASSNLSMPNSLNGVRDVVQKQVDALRAEGVEIIVLLSHLQGAWREMQLVKSGLVGVDVIVAGGGENKLAAAKHRLVAGDVPDRLCNADAFGAPCYPTALSSAEGKPVLLVATGGDLRYVGHLVTSFDAAGVLTGFDAATSRPWPVDEESLLELRASVDKTTLAFQQRVQHELQPLLEVVAESTVYLEGAREQVRNRETNFGDLSADAIQHAAGDAAALALRNGGGIRGSIGSVDPVTLEKKGSAIRLIDLKTALRFDSKIVVVEATHAQLKATLESALRGAGTSKGQFPQVSSSVEIEYATEAPEQAHVLEGGRIARLSCEGARVRNLIVKRNGQAPIVVVKDGVLVTPAEKISVATLEYLSNGGDGWFPGMTGLKVKPVEGATEQSSVRALIASLEKRGEWRGGATYADGPQTRIKQVPLSAPVPGCSP